MLQNAPTFCWPTMVHNNKIGLRKVTGKGCPVSSSPYEGCFRQNQESCFRIIWAPFLWHYKDCQCLIVMLYYTPEMCSVWLFLQSNSIVFKFSCCLGLNNWWQFFNWMFSTFRSSRKTWQQYSTIFDDGRMVLRWEKTKNFTKGRRALHGMEWEWKWVRIILNWNRGRESLLLLTGLKGVVDSKDEVKTSSLQNILRPEVESDISRATRVA